MINKKIDLEEAMIVPGQENMVSDHKKHPEFMENFERLTDIGPIRLAEMDQADIQGSVLSLTAPGMEDLADTSNLETVAREWNDYMEDKVNNYPDRFKGMACILLADTKLSKKDAFVGCLINSFTNSGGTEPKYLDRPEFDDFWACAAQLDFPVYLHPRGVLEERLQTAFGDIHKLNGSVQPGDSMLN